MSGFSTVHVRINDSVSGRPVPVRLRIAGPQGEFFAPFGRCVDFPTGRHENVGAHLYWNDKKYVYIDGQSEIILPTEIPLQVQASRGPEYEPIQRTVTLTPGQMALRLEIRRWADFRSKGWYSADCRCHDLSPHTALLEGGAEDVHFVHLLASFFDYPSQDGHLYTNHANITAFSGQQPALADGERLVAVNTFNTHPALGRLALLFCHRAVFPLQFGGGDSTDDWSLAAWADQCHRKHGLVVWCDAYRYGSGVPGGEALVAAILGKIDALELTPTECSPGLLVAYYRLLNAGVYLPVVGASGKDSNRIPLGAMRTYTRLNVDKPELADWVEATRQGCTFATTGIGMEFQANGSPPGRTLVLDSGTVAVEARTLWPEPVDKLEIIVNGDTAATSTDGSLQIDLDLPAGGWIAARATTPARHEWGPSAGHLVHSSPIVVLRAGQPRWSKPQAVATLLRQIQGTREWVESTGRYCDEKNRQRLLDSCENAAALLRKRFDEQGGRSNA